MLRCATWLSTCHRGGRLEQSTYLKLQQCVVREIRGELSQGQINLRFGYTFNQVSKWETGKAHISWENFVKFCTICKKDMTHALQVSFDYSGEPQDHKALVQHILGDKKKGDNEGAAVSRFKLYRWLNKDSSPNWSDFFAFIHDLIPVRSILFLKMLGGKDLKFYSRLLEYKQEVLEPNDIKAHLCNYAMFYFYLEEYTKSPVHIPGYLAKKMGINLVEEENLIQGLLKMGVLEKGSNGKYLLTRCDNSYTFSRSDVATNYSCYLLDIGRQFLQKKLKENSTPSRAQAYHVTIATSCETIKKIGQVMLEAHEKIMRLVYQADELGVPVEEIRILNMQYLDPAIVISEE